MTLSAVGFRLRRTVFATILFYAVGILIVCAVLLCGCLALIAWMGKEPAFNPVGAALFLPLLASTLAPQFPLVIWAAGAALRREKVLMIDARSVRLTGVKPLLVQRAEIESVKCQSARWRPWSETVIINLRGGQQAYLWAYHFEGRGEAIMRALEGAPGQRGPWG